MENNMEVSEKRKNFFTRAKTGITEFYEEYKTERPVTSKLVMLAIAGVLLAIILLFVHNQTVYSKAVAFDDNQYVFENNLVKNPSISSVKKFFVEVLNPSTVTGYYQPLAMISLMVDSALGGSKSNMHIFHITSLCIHILNSFLVLILLYLLFKKIWLGFVGGLMFGIHPVAIEEIAWISERKSLLATLFLLISLILYVLYVKSGKKRHIIISMIVFVLALMSKPIAVSLPVIILILDYFWFKRLSFMALFEKIPYFIIAIVSTVIAFISQNNTAGIEVTTQSLNIFQIALLVCYNNIFYLWKILIPTGLSPYYSFIDPISLSNPSYLVPGILTLILIIGLVFTWRKSKHLLVGYLFFIISLLPTVGILKVTDSMTCYKYAYFPSIGVLICIIILFHNLANKKISKQAKSIIIIFVVCLISISEIYASNIYSTKWKDSETLYNHMLTINPNSPTILNAVGTVYYNDNKFDKSLEYYNKSVSINPSIGSTYIYLGAVYAAKEQNDEAISAYQKAIEFHKKSIKSGQTSVNQVYTYFNLGLIYKSENKLEMAQEMFEEAIKQNPNYIDASLELAITLNRLGKFDDAVSICKNIINKYPNTEAAYTYLGVILAENGQYKEAVSQISISLSKNPYYPYAYYSLGNVLANDKKYTEAAMCYDEAIRLEPGNIKIYNDYGKLYAQQGKFENAISMFEKSVNTLANSTAYNLLGMAYEDTGKYIEALNSYKKAYDMNSTSQEIQENINRVTKKVK